MKITRFETFLANAGLRNYLFIRLTTDTGLTGVGEATLEWQEKTVQTLCHEWVEGRVLGRDPFDIETRRRRHDSRSVPGRLDRDDGHQRRRDRAVGHRRQGLRPAGLSSCSAAAVTRGLPAYANGWYGGADTPAEFAERARDVVARGYRAMKFDPFGTAWKEMSARRNGRAAVERVAKVREAVGPKVGLMIEFHGRLSARGAVEMIRRLEPYRPDLVRGAGEPRARRAAGRGEAADAAADRGRRAADHARPIFSG